MSGSIVRWLKFCRQTGILLTMVIVTAGLLSVVLQSLGDAAGARFFLGTAAAGSLGVGCCLLAAVWLLMQHCLDGDSPEEPFTVADTDAGPIRQPVPIPRERHAD